MSLSHHLSVGERTRSRIARTGLTARGDRVWSPEETEALRRLFPDRKSLRVALPSRTPIAIDRKASKLGLVTRLHAWTGSEVSRLRKLWTTGKHKAEVLEAFPGMTWSMITNQAQYSRLRRPRRAPATT